MDRLSKTSERDRTALEFSWSRAASALHEMWGEKELESVENINILMGAWNFFNTKRKKELIPREEIPPICDAHWHKTVEGAVGSD